MIEFLQFIERVPLMLLAAALDMNSVRIFFEDAFGSLNYIYAAVRSRQIGIVIKRDDFAFRRIDQADVYIAQRVLLSSSRHRLCRNVSLRRDSIRVTGCSSKRDIQIGHRIDVHALRHRPQPMRRLEICRFA